MKPAWAIAIIGISWLLLGGDAVAAGGQLIVDAGNRAKAEKAAEAYIRNILKDPESAKFKFPLPPVAGVLNALTITHSGYFLCGEVNARNSYGGYTGNKEFLVIFSDISLSTVAQGTVESPGSGVIMDWCTNIYREVAGPIGWKP